MRAVSVIELSAGTYEQARSPGLHPLAPGVLALTTLSISLAIPADAYVPRMPRNP